jgi:hypothetical protein
MKKLSFTQIKNLHKTYSYPNNKPYEGQPVRVQSAFEGNFDGTFKGFSTSKLLPAPYYIDVLNPKTGSILTVHKTNVTFSF